MRSNRAHAWASRDMVEQQMEQQYHATITRVDLEQYPEVTIAVQVFDTAGQPVVGLDRGWFQVREQDQAVGLSRFAAVESDPLSIILMIDRSGSMAQQGKMNAAKDAARSFISALRAEDQLAIIAFSDAYEVIQEFTSNREELIQAVGPLRPDGATALYDSLIAAASLGGAAPSARRQIILLTDGRDLRRAGDPQPASRQSLAQALDAIRLANIPVTAVGLGAEDATPGQDAIDRAVLEQIATASNGSYLAVPDPADLVRHYRELATQLQYEYLLTYRSSLPRATPDRMVRVIVGAVAELVVPPVAPPPERLPLEWLPLAGVPIALAGVLLWRRRRMLAREYAQRPPAVTGATVVLESPRFCIECGQALHPGAVRCESCHAPIELPRR